MMLLADWDLEHAGQRRRIELYWGDLSYLPPEHAVDILVVSAFPNDYMPTPGSLIGALDRNGVSVYRLSFAKDRDLRDEFSCWLSQPVGVESFKRLLCVESGWRGSPPEIADDLFRALAPLSVTHVETGSVAMPLIGAGDQGYDAEQMLEAILKAAVGWIRRGMPVDLLKIVAYTDAAASAAKKRFLEVRKLDSRQVQSDPQWDVFLSYSSKDLSAAEHIHTQLTNPKRPVRVFQDRRVLKEGGSWLMEIASALDSARCVLALYSPDYWASQICRDELSAAYVRHASGETGVLFPVFYRNTDIPSFFQAFQYSDCREADMDKLAAACRQVSERIGSR